MQLISVLYNKEDFLEYTVMNTSNNYYASTSRNYLPQSEILQEQYE
jgi:hypothetical protein